MSDWYAFPPCRLVALHVVSFIARVDIWGKVRKKWLLIYPVLKKGTFLSQTVFKRSFLGGHPLPGVPADILQTRDFCGRLIPAVIRELGQPLRLCMIDAVLRRMSVRPFHMHAAALRGEITATRNDRFDISEFGRRTSRWNLMQSPIQYTWSKLTLFQSRICVENHEDISTSIETRCSADAHATKHLDYCRGIGVRNLASASGSSWLNPGLIRWRDGWERRFSWRASWALVGPSSRWTWLPGQDVSYN